MKIVPSKYLNLLTDFAFKRIFGSEACKDLLIDFLNELIDDQGRIINLKYLPTEQLGKTGEDRKAIFDIYCQSDCDKYFIVELQRVKQKYFKERSIFYSSFPIQSQAPKGEWDFNLYPVYTIAIVDFVLFEDEKSKEFFYHSARLRNDRTYDIFYDKLIYKYLELPKFNKTLENLETNFDRWTYLLKNLPILEKRPPELQGEIFEKLFEFAAIERLTLEEMKEYKKSVLEYSDVRDALEYAKEEAARVALEKGHKEEKYEIAKKCLQKGMSLEDISDITGLSIEHLTELQNLH